MGFFGAQEAHDIKEVGATGRAGQGAAQRLEQAGDFEAARLNPLLGGRSELGAFERLRFEPRGVGAQRFGCVGVLARGLFGIFLPLESGCGREQVGDARRQLGVQAKALLFRAHDVDEPVHARFEVRLRRQLSVHDKAHAALR